MSSSTSEKLRSKHIRTLEALADLTRENTSLQQQIAQLQHTLDLRNAVEQEINSSKETNDLKIQQLTEQINKVEFDNQQLAKQTEQSVEAIAELKREHALALASLRKSKLSLAREAGEAKTKFEEIQQENENMREEFMDLREKSTKAWEYEVSNREHVITIQKLKDEIDRLKIEEQKQRDEYVNNLKQTELDASKAIQVEKEQSKKHFIKKEKEWEKFVHTKQMELNNSKKHILELEQLLKDSTERYKSLEMKLSKTIETTPPPRAPTSPKVNVDELKNQIMKLNTIIKEKNVIIEKLKKEILDKENQNNDGKGFGAFIDMKRENQVLRAQIKDLMTTQARILGGSKARRVQPGSGRRRR
jgi:hypothetical protein